ncbi:histidine kinase/DNA gyrase B/HSP90-like ATPase [Maribacter spongiicola]|uniref:histidine kinase n=1 Tax=Maribacter spongiicola TaxID=1206753 RepID=A0A4R7JKJ6_9FLAO|nr:ATP-binding protein [Maribacter spongiicola]TDT37976.1 histidine kinase/DNA gyrase B/HSP90-like ATPase [Maribacter spongiicola]
MSKKNTFTKGSKKIKFLDEFGLIAIISSIFTFAVFIYTLFFHSYTEQALAFVVALGFGIGFILNRLKLHKTTRIYMTLFPPVMFMSLIFLIGGFFGQAVAFATMGFLAFIGYRRNPRTRNLIIAFDILAFIIPTIYISIYGPILGVIDVPFDEIFAFLACLGWLSLTFRMYDQNKTRTYTNDLENHITALKESELNLKIAQNDLKNQNNKLAVLNNELELKNTQIEEFTFIVTHDLRGPLNNINVIATELEKQHSDANYANFSSYLKHLQGSSTRLTNLVEGLLKYAEIGNSSGMESVNIAEVIQLVVDDLSESIKVTKATLNIGKMPTLIARPSDIRMLFQNLIHNALKFKTNDGQPVINITSEKKENEYLFIVSDNGIGIPKEQLENVFNAFHKLHNQSKFEGSGIGLYGSKKIVDHHLGKIWVESEENVGSTFYFTINTNSLEHHKTEKHSVNLN